MHARMRAAAALRSESSETAPMHATPAYLDAAARRTPASMSLDCAFMQVMNTLLVNVQTSGQSRPKLPRRSRKTAKTGSSC
jgi:hypothetical protein